MSCQQHTQEASENYLAPKIPLGSQVPQLLPEPQCLADLSYANLLASPVELCRAIVGWLNVSGFFPPDVLGVTEKNMVPILKA